jgi:hypothetical protein
MTQRSIGMKQVLVLISMIVVGCSSDTKHGAVNGTVTLDGQPIKTGIVRFVPADGQTATADAVIAEGKFTANVPPGEKRVEISAPKVVGKRRMMPESPEIEITEELLPARYNVKTELTLTVTAGSQSKDFELQSK